MTFGISFVGLCSRPLCVPNGKKFTAHDNHRSRISHAKRRRAIWRSTQDQEHTEDHQINPHHETIRTGSFTTQPSITDSETLKEPERLVMDDITETGMKEIEEIASEAKDNLEDVRLQIEENAPKIIAEETEALLEKYEHKRKDLLDNIRRDREIISKEMEEIQRLADNGERKNTEKRENLREKAYFLMSAVFIISALYYGWKGITDGDSDAFRNAAIDAAVAAACTLAFSVGKRKQ